MIEIIPNGHSIFVHFTVNLLLGFVALHVAVLFTREPLAVITPIKKASQRLAF